MGRRDHRRAAVIAAIAIAILVRAAPARADDPEARELFREGVAALRENDFARAERAFRMSWEREPLPAAMCNLALTYDRWGGHVQQAIEAYDRCAADDTSGRFASHARSRASELRAMPIEPQRPPDTTTRPPDTTTPPPSNEPPPLVLVPSDAPAPGGAATTSWSPAPAREDASRSHALLYVGIGGAVVSVGAVIVGLVFMQEAHGVDDDLARDYPDGRIPARLPDGRANPDVAYLDDGKDAAAVGTAMYVVGAALGAVSVALIAIDLSIGSASSESAARVSLAPSRDGATITTSMRF